MSLAFIVSANLSIIFIVPVACSPLSDSNTTDFNVSVSASGPPDNISSFSFGLRYSNFSVKNGFLRNS